MHRYRPPSKQQVGKSSSVRLLNCSVTVGMAGLDSIEALPLDAARSRLCNGSLERHSPRDIHPVNVVDSDLLGLEAGSSPSTTTQDRLLLVHDAGHRVLLSERTPPAPLLPQRSARTLPLGLGSPMTPRHGRCKLDDAPFA